MPDKPFFMYLAPGATHAPHHVPKEWSDKYRGKFDDGWDVSREKIMARQKELGVVPADADLTRAMTRSRPGMTCPPNSSRCWRARWRSTPDFRADRPRSGPHPRRPRGPRCARRHPDLLHHRRQRRLGRRHPERLLQRNRDGQRHARRGDHRVPAVQDQRFRHAEGLQPLRGGLGARDVHALSVDQADRLALGRHPQRHHRALAQRLRRQGHDPQPVPPRHRHRPHHPGGRRTARADIGERHPAGAVGGRQHAGDAARRRAPRKHTPCSTSRCSATAASTTRAGRR